jgi:hypothetical protein
MSGLHRLSRRRARRFAPGQASEFTFGLIALAILATLAVGMRLVSPGGPLFEPMLLLGLL